ncbi:unnamed protein product [Gordionus sp. m RMFG-2023]
MGRKSAFKRDLFYAIIMTSLVWILIDIFVLMILVEKNLLRISMRKKCEINLHDLHNYYNSTPEYDPILNYDPPYVVGMPDDSDTNVTTNNPEFRVIPKKTGYIRLGLGENGSKIILSDDYNDAREKRFHENQFDVFVSELIALNRTLPDTRAPGCYAKQYPWNLPNSSIIIVYHNEAWTTLLRNVHSIINRTPKDLLVEIILVDDFSDMAHLGRPLDDYIKTLEQITRIVIIRLRERSGIIRARLAGSRIAVGQVLTFLDAHCEVNDGWLEPLLSEIYDDKTKVVAPIIDAIDAHSFEYVPGNDLKIGGLDWFLNFRWYDCPVKEMERRNHDRSQPILTPTHAGGLFSIDRDYFKYLGEYDEGMEVWGSENLELSLRVWLCGGTLEIIPCSRVGHVFRVNSPYTFPGGALNVIHRNQKRLVEVWFDEWKDFYYKANKDSLKINAGYFGERLELKKRLNCKPFRWFLENIYRDFQMPLNLSSLYYIHGENSSLCMDSRRGDAKDDLELFKCHGGHGQIFYHDHYNQLRNDDFCVEYWPIKQSLRLKFCNNQNPNQKWFITKTGHIKSAYNVSLCISSEIRLELNYEIGVVLCEGSNNIKWIFENIF